MNRATFPELLQCVNPTGAYCPNMTVLERQRACLKWQKGIYDDFYVSGLSGGGAFGMTSQGLIVANNNPVKFDPGVHNEWPDFGGNCGMNSEMGVLETNYGMTPKASLGPVAMTGMSTPDKKVKEGVVADHKCGQVGKESLRKRKVDKLSIIIKSEEEEEEEEEKEEKKIKGLWTEETESKLTFLSNNDNKKKNSEVQKQDYIHVRARRGQATDSHSLAERVRREKISERMKFLQDLVPGCNKITGKAGMLDEIINYVQSLQRQVEFLSMKLAAVNNHSLDLDIIDSLSAKEISPACTPNFSTIEAGPSELTNQGYHLHFNPASQELESCVGMELGVNPDPGLWRRISAPMAVTQQQQQQQQMQAQSATTWDDISLQNLYNIEFQQ